MTNQSIQDQIKRNNQKCDALRQESVASNNVAFSYGNSGMRDSLERRNKVKSICLECELKRCVYG